MKIAISRKHLPSIGAIIGLIGLIAICVYYGWILALSILFCVWGNNIERSNDIVDKIEKAIMLLRISDQQKRKQQ